jgi:group I intron endonuclease
MVMSKNIVGIYSITNLVNRKTYIGKSSNVFHRWDIHKSRLLSGTHTNIHLQNSWNKHGEDNFEFRIIRKFKIYDEEQISNSEIFYIKKFNSKNPENGYNKTVGGEGLVGYVYTDEEKKNRSRVAKKRWNNISERLKQSISAKLFMSKPEVKKKMSDGQIKRFQNPDQRKNTSEKSILQWSDLEARKRRSEATIKQFSDPEQRRKRSETAKASSAKGLETKRRLKLEREEEL